MNQWHCRDLNDPKASSRKTKSHINTDQKAQLSHMKVKTQTLENCFTSDQSSSQAISNSNNLVLSQMPKF